MIMSGDIGSKMEMRRQTHRDGCVSLAEKGHHDAGTGTSEMDGDEEHGIAMEV